MAVFVFISNRVTVAAIVSELIFTWPGTASIRGLTIFVFVTNRVAVALKCYKFEAGDIGSALVMVSEGFRILLPDLQLIHELMH